MGEPSAISRVIVSGSEDGRPMEIHYRQAQHVSLSPRSYASSVLSSCVGDIRCAVRIGGGGPQELRHVGRGLGVVKLLGV